MSIIELTHLRCDKCKAISGHGHAAGHLVRRLGGKLGWHVEYGKKRHGDLYPPAVDICPDCWAKRGEQAELLPMSEVGDETGTL